VADHVLWRMAVAMALVVPWVVAGSACSVDEIDLDGKKCPCADGYVCDSTSNTCVKEGASSGGAGGTSGSGGASGSAGSSSGGASGSAGSASGGASGSAGSASGGASGSGGTNGEGIVCGTSKCSVATQVCCHADDGVTADGSCTDTGTACGSGFIVMQCDDPSDCGTGSEVCCERLSQVGHVNSIQCETASANCKPLGSGTSAELCLPGNGDCPAGKTCIQTTRGYYRCE